MKNIVWLSIISSLLILGSCQGLLDVEPENSVTFVNYFKTEKDLETSVNAIREEFLESSVKNASKPPICRGMLYDSLSTYQKAEVNLDPGISNSPISVSLLWSGYYTVIALSNIVLDNVDQAEIPENRIDFYRGQAYFYRGYEYLFLAQAWGEAPIMRHSRDVGARAKARWSELMDIAIADAEQAVNLLPMRDGLMDAAGNKITKRDVVSKEVAWVLLGQALAWKAGLTEDAELFKRAADTLTNVIKSPHYSLAPNPEVVVTDVLVGGNMTESIFEMQNNWTESATQGNPFLDVDLLLTWPIKPEDGMGDITDCDVRLTYEHMDRMFPKGDLRREAYFFAMDSIYDDPELREKSKGYVYPYKYRKVLIGTDGYYKGKFINIDQNRILYRLADVILLRAECYARSGQRDLAIADLNRVRDRAKAALYPAPGDSDDIQLAVFREREKELMWECVRWFDLIRNGYWAMISDAYARLTPQNILDGALYLPITAQAFNDNKLMVQNRYWLSRY